MILAIDTTSEFGSIALMRGPEDIDEVILRSPDGFAHVLYPHIRWLLERHAVALRDIECFAAAAGPGSFTGVRVGLAAAKGLAEATGRPAAGISNLRGLAVFGARPLRATILDARRGEAYAAVYNEDLRMICPEVVTALPAWIAALPAGDLEFIATDFAPFRPALAGTRFAGAHIVTAPRALAGAIARIAWQGREFADPAALDANYVRRSDAELFWKE